MNQPTQPVPFEAMPPAPKTLGQILDRVLQLLRANLRLFLKLASIPMATILLTYPVLLPVMFKATADPRHPPSPEAVSILFCTMFLCSLPICAVFALYMAAASWAATQADLGIQVTFRQAWVLALRRAGRNLWLALLLTVIGLAPLLLIYLAVFATAVPATNGKGFQSPLPFVLLPLGMLASFIYALLAGLRLSLAFPASVAEDLSAIAAIRRSFALTKRAMGRIFLVGLVTYAASYFIFLVFMVVIFALFGVVMLPATLLHMHMVPWGYIGMGFVFLCMLAGFFLYFAVSWSAQIVGLAVLYHDQRLRFDTPAPTLPANPETA